MALLYQKTIFLTGGSTGIGWECAKAYAAAGANVVIAASSREQVEDAIKQLGPQHLGVECDVSNASDVEAAILQTITKYGRLDAIHNNAGIATPSKPLHETSDQEWNRLMDVNLKSVLFTTRFGFEALKQTKGCILNTSSLVGEIGQENHAAYTATKGAMNALTKSMALDYAPYNIRVNAVSPAGVWTPMLREWSKEQPNPASIEKYLDKIHPLGYCPEGDVIADACVFLLSDKARFITGTILPVSGGAELGYRRTY
ncbi:NAD(P)-dependent dehydrogenase (short-subunit alcohol dehydrogenase family) [Chitinophaga niastensis]|uniref:NAD(P)-dependent dehydrogenase (Short-subunit alcohol dehydrogenase family) n=1 Tax=Chitinophaga niastensis TaxID=536980 RepID=A0A2P8HJE8_CHINA|nr:SDR family oxidoreductase [Chitinophaga niastensis]PSL46300.1 NAD(P)-dependent dehydrogenase (short-subunit alcohol dehydrogenase family) [Chitinophaga niastensis]